MKKISISKFATFIKYSASSVTSFVLDNGINLLLFHFLKNIAGIPAESISIIIARVFSSFFNFMANRKLVFKNDEKFGRSLLKYYALCIPQAAISVIFVPMLNRRLNETNNSLLETVIKICLETVIFLISYQIQKRWVFKK